jgi:hypothetical protein
VHWLAEWWSSTYRPVSRCTRNELAIRSFFVRAWTAGSCRASQRTFGPTAWLVSGDPPRARISSAPSSWSSSAISALARVSTP